MVTLNRKSALEQRIADIQDQIARLERFGEDDDAGDVLMYDAPAAGFQRHHTRLTYVALKKGGKWWISNGQNRPYSWDELVGMMSESPEVWVATEWAMI